MYGCDANHARSAVDSDSFYYRCRHSGYAEQLFDPADRVLCNVGSVNIIVDYRVNVYLICINLSLVDHLVCISQVTIISRVRDYY